MSVLGNGVLLVSTAAFGQLAALSLGGSADAVFPPPRWGSSAWQLRLVLGIAATAQMGRTRQVSG